MKKLSGIFLLLYIFVSHALYADDIKKIIILNFSYENTTEEHALNAKNNARTILSQTGFFTMIPEDKIEKVITKKDPKLELCVTPECAVAIGQKTGADIVLLGSIQKEDLFVISIKYINVKNGRIMLTDSEVAADETKFDKALYSLIDRTMDDLLRNSNKYEEIDDSKKEKKKSSSFFLGFGLGGGYAWLFPENQYFDQTKHISSSIDFILSTHLGVGAAINKNIHLGIDVSLLAMFYHGSYDDGSVKTKFKSQRQFSNFFLNLRYYPSGEGFFFKLGGGFSMLSTQLKFNSQAILNTTDFDDKKILYGGGIAAGMGYDFKITKIFHIALQADYTFDAFKNGNSLDKGHRINAYISFFLF